MGWAPKYRFEKKSCRIRKKNHGFGTKYRFEFVLIYIELRKKSWVWHEVQIWICYGWGRKIMGGAKYRFEFVLIYIEWGKKIMGWEAKCRFEKKIIYNEEKKSWVWHEVQIWILKIVKETVEKLWVCHEVHIWFPIIL